MREGFPDYLEGFVLGGSLLDFGHRLSQEMMLFCRSVESTDLNEAEARYLFGWLLKSDLLTEFLGLNYAWDTPCNREDFGAVYRFNPFFGMRYGCIDVRLSIFSMLIGRMVLNVRASEKRAAKNYSLPILLVELLGYAQSEACCKDKLAFMLRGLCSSIHVALVLGSGYTSGYGSAPYLKAFPYPSSAELRLIAEHFFRLKGMVDHDFLDDSVFRSCVNTLSQIALFYSQPEIFLAKKRPAEISVFLGLKGLQPAFKRDVAHFVVTVSKENKVKELLFCIWVVSTAQQGCLHALRGVKSLVAGYLKPLFRMPFSCQKIDPKESDWRARFLVRLVSSAFEFDSTRAVMYLNFVSAVAEFYAKLIVKRRLLEEIKVIDSGVAPSLKGVEGGMHCNVDRESYLVFLFQNFDAESIQRYLKKSSVALSPYVCLLVVVQKLMGVGEGGKRLSLNTVRGSLYLAEFKVKVQSLLTCIVTHEVSPGKSLPVLAMIKRLLQDVCGSDALGEGAGVDCEKGSSLVCKGF